MKAWWSLWALLLVLSGCATQTIPGPTGTRLERPVSEETVMSDARRKAKVHVELGQAYFQAGRFGVALDEARAALSHDANYAPAYQLMALVHMFLEEAPLAAANFDRALSLAPGDPEILNSYGWFLCSIGREKEGIEQLAVVVRNPYYPSPTKGFANAGLCYLRMNNDRAAETQFLRAVEADASNLQAIYHLAALTYRRGAYEAARRYLNALNQGGEPTAESLWLGIRIEHKLGDRAAEAAYVQQLRRRFPASQEFQAFLQGQYE